MRYALLFALAFLSLACANVRTPTVTVRGVSLGGITADGMTLNVDLAIANPNAFAIPVGHVDYSLQIAAVQSLSGSITPAATLAAKADTPLVLPLTIQWDDLLATKDAIVKSGGDVPFTLSGKIIPSGAIGFFGGGATVPLSYSGTLPLREALRDPEAVMSSPAARELAKALLMHLAP